MKKIPEKLTRAVQQIRRSARNPQKLRYACDRYKDIFAVYPHSLDKLPPLAKNILLSLETPEENASFIPATTPAELNKITN